ncbi:murein hydrolase activator EnvC family protein [Candidatus Poriferisodalis sp.]|uniref:murein hydrolase activator EnvC family protein n=1 Tax=Candidatus Poriferisodalis sp. TaxID=3101277 RepID=UPI003B0115F8
MFAVGSDPASAQSEPPTPEAPTQSAPQLAYIRPVRGTVIDPFRPPAERWGAGNRGWEFATQPDSPFWAAAHGVVSFAGPVGGRLHVTVSHPDGLRVSYSGVATIGVRRGQHVEQGRRLGTTGKRLHVGVRRGDVYLDPASIFGPVERSASASASDRVRLVPTVLPVYRLQLRWIHFAAGSRALGPGVR